MNARPLDEIGRVIGRVLKERHPDDYPETPDGFEWWSIDAQNVKDFIDRMGERGNYDFGEAIQEALVDTGLHDDIDWDQRECCRRDAVAISDAILRWYCTPKGLGQ